MMAPLLHPDDYARNHKFKSRELLVTYLSTGGLLLSIVAGASISDYTARNTIWFGGLLSGICAYNSRQNCKEREWLLQQQESISNSAYIERLFKATTTAEKGEVYEGELIEPDKRLVPFDWDRLKESPHLAIIGETGSGKTTLAEGLCKSLGGYTIAVAPHWEQGDFPDVNLVVGAGRAYGTNAFGHCEELESSKYEPEPAVNIQDIREKPLAGGVTVTQFFNALVREMDRRYQLNGGLRVGGDELNIIIDEYNAFAKKPGVGEALKLLLREARKVKIRIILLCQGSEVRALGIEGEGSIRECLTQIRLGRFAKNHASSLLPSNSRNPDYDFYSSLLAQIKEDSRQGRRSCLVEDCYAIVPEISKTSDGTLPTVLPQDKLRAPEPSLEERVLSYIFDNPGIKAVDIKKNIKELNKTKVAEIREGILHNLIEQEKIEDKQDSYFVI